MRALIVISALLASQYLLAQDPHYSQFFASPLNLNPALAGATNRDYRLVGNFASQWGGFTTPYVNMSASFDAKAHFLSHKRRLNKDIWGWGFGLASDKAGDSELSTSQFNSYLSYDRQIDRRGKQHFRLGVGVGLAQKRIDMSALRFDDQFNGLNFDGTTGTREQLANDQIIYLDVTPGIVWYYLIGNHHNIFLGYNRAHVNSPKLSFFNDGNIRLFQKNTFHAGGQFRASPKVDILPSAMFVRQDVSQEIIFGAFVNYGLIERDLHTFRQANVLLGAWYRLKDAVILAAMFEYDEFSFGLSYDMNVSDLRKASKLNGGPELSIIYNAYIPEKFKLKNKGSKFCPRFM